MPPARNLLATTVCLWLLGVHNATVAATNSALDAKSALEVPEPGLLALFGVGLFVLAAHARRRMQTKKQENPALPEVAPPGLN